MLYRLIIGVLLGVVVATLAQRRPPNYSQDKMPATSFSCRDKIIGGYYADPETDCQMFHVCVKVPGQGVQDYKFLCPNDTSFDQENQICDDWFNIDCEASTLYYSDNFDLYRIGSDFPSSNQSPRLPSNNINNAVSEDDDFYLQKSDRSENVGSDLLRGSHSSNFYSNKNRGREDDDDVKEEYKKKPSKNNVRKLLTGKRPIASTQAPVETYSTTASQYQPRTHNNNYSGRVSQFRGHVKGQQTTSEATAAPTRQTETYNRGQSFQRNYYTPTTPKVETTTATQRTEYFRNYNPTTKRNYYENTQNFNVQTTGFAQTTKNYYNPRVTTTTTTVQPSTVYVETTASDNARNNYYETQKLFQLNTAAFNQYDEPKDEFLKTAPSQNLGASAFNSLQNSLKSYNTSVSSTYNFNPKPTTINYQTQTYFTPSTQAPNYYTQTTLKPFQQNNYYTTSKVQTTEQNYQQNYFNPSAQTTAKQAPQYNPTTIRPYQQQSFSQAAQTTFQQYNPTTLKPLQQQQYNPTTLKPFQQQYNPTTLKPSQQQQYNPTTLKPFQQQYNPTTLKPVQQQQQQYNPTTVKPFQQQYSQSTPKPFQQQYNHQQNYQTATAIQAQQTTNYQSQKNTAAPQNYQQPQKNQQQFQSQRNPSQFQQTSNYYNPTTQRTYQTTIHSRGKVSDTTEQPRPFTQVTSKPEKKEKEQYDYAYYDDGTQSEYDSIEPLEEFKKTKSKY